jgi:fluoride exporter
MYHLGLIALGGSLGALARHYSYSLAEKLFGTSLVWGTFIVNWIGAFLIGVFFVLLEKTILPGNAKSFLIVGFLGALTTFSTYSIETYHFIRQANWPMTAISILGNNVISIAAVFAGVQITRLLLSR